jgi:integrase
MNKDDLNDSHRVSVFLSKGEDVGLRDGHPALFCAHSMRLLEEPTAFLIDRYVRSGKRTSPRTWRNAAHGLKSWLEFLAASKIDDWRDATLEDFEEYRDVHAGGISERGEPYATGTIAGRMFVILAYYEYAQKRGWYDGTLTTRSQVRGRLAPRNTDPLAHTRRTRRPRLVSDAIPNAKRSDEKVRPFSTTELRVFLPALGPRPEQRSADPRSSRDRVMGDLGVFAGLRLDEIHQLTTYHFQSLHPNPATPLVGQPITVRRKGGFVQTVLVPSWLAGDVLEFIETERTEWLKGAGLWRRAPSAIFVGNPNSTAPGAPLGHRRMQQIIAEACHRVGSTRILHAVDPDSGEAVQRVKAAHSIHDLRHTYAVLTYWARKQDGDPEPWKYIQAQMGHANLQTTIDIYLRHAQFFGAKERLSDVRKVIGL